MRKAIVGLFCLAGSLASAPAAANPVILPGSASSGSLASQLTELASLIKPTDDTCSDHCWLLDRMHLGGAVDHTIDFEVTGQVLHKGSFAIPLFGPADKIRVTDVTENGSRATLGFEDGHYYVQTSDARFTIRGKLVLGDDRALTIVGPLNALDAEVKGGRITEGAHLSALAGMQLHFDAEGDVPAAQPPIFSIARAIRVGKSVEFEYRVTAQSGTELGLIRLPLRYGEHVIDVDGAPGWRTESEDLLLPTNGKTATITVTGTIANVASFSPDTRAPFEWWLLESDGEHRIVATGDAKQHDVSESPIVHKEPNSRLYLVTRGQHLDVTVQTLESLDVLAATIRSNQRTLVLTASGDLVEQDVLAYENSGIDYLYYTPDGRPIYLATDGSSERVMHKDGSSELMIPMRQGSHYVTVQSLSHQSIASLFGRVAMPGSRVPLATGSAMVTVGLPESVHPILVTGGEHTTWPLQPIDGGALAFSALGAALVVAGWKKRALGTATLFGLWFVSKPLFIVALGAAAVTFVWPYVARMNKVPRRIAIAIAMLASFVIGVSMISSRMEKSASFGAVADAKDMKNKENEARSEAAVSTPTTIDQPVQALAQAAEFGMIAGRAGLVDGVRPVPLSIPSYVHAAYAERELVTPSKSFSPVVYYVTDSGLAVIALAWFACAGALAWLSRDKLRALRDAMRAALAPKPTEPAATQPAPAT